MRQGRRIMDCSPPDCSWRRCLAKCKRDSMVSPESWHRARNVLCVRLDSLGDVLMTTPALRAVKTSCPGRRVALLTSPAGAEAASLVPEVDEVFVYEAPWM